MKGILDRYEGELAVILIERENLELHIDKARLATCNPGDVIDFTLVNQSLLMRCNKQAGKARKDQAEALRKILLERSKNNFRRE